MNKQRRKVIQDAADLIAQAQELLNIAAEEEREFYDNMPESLQGSERGQRADEVANFLEEAASALEDVDLSDALA